MVISVKEREYVRMTLAEACALNVFLRIRQVGA